MKKTGRVDERRIYAAGHSNGGIFVYLLWAVRGDVFAAFATSCSMAATAELQRRLVPKPLFHITGQTAPDRRLRPADGDGLVRAFPERVRDGGSGMERQRALHAVPVDEGVPVVTYIHRGGHVFESDAVPLAVAFLKEHARP